MCVHADVSTNTILHVSHTMPLCVCLHSWLQPAGSSGGHAAAVCGAAFVCGGAGVSLWRHGVRRMSAGGLVGITVSVVGQDHRRGGVRGEMAGQLILNFVVHRVHIVCAAWMRGLDVPMRILTCGLGERRSQGLVGKKMVTWWHFSLCCGSADLQGVRDGDVVAP